MSKELRECLKDMVNRMDQIPPKFHNTKEKMDPIFIAFFDQLEGYLGDPPAKDLFDQLLGLTAKRKSNSIQLKPTSRYEDLIETIKRALRDLPDPQEGMPTEEMGLVEACAKGELPRVKKLLLEGQDVNQRNSSEDTGLHMACFNGHDHVVEVLLAHPSIDVNVRTSLGGTPLFLACMNGSPSVIQLLLRHKEIDVNAHDNFHKTSLWMAAFKNLHVSIINLILSGRDLDLNYGSADFTDVYPSTTPLQVAREKGHTDVVELLEVFQQNPNQTRESLQKEYSGIGCISLVSRFDLVMFLTDCL